MTWYPTNTDDVTLIVSQVVRDDSGTRTGTEELANTNAIVVDDFSIGSEEDLEALSGIGNHKPLGISRGDVEYTFSFTVSGEDAALFASLAEEDGSAVELEIILIAQDYRDKLVGARAGTREVSGSTGDALEYVAEGIATDRDPQNTAS